MNKPKKVLVIAIASVTALWIVGCCSVIGIVTLSTITHNPKDAIVGKWKAVDADGLDLEFSKDGTFSVDAGLGFVVTGEYEVVDNSHLRMIDSSGLLGFGEPQVFQMKLAGNRLTLYLVKERGYDYIRK